MGLIGAALEFGIKAAVGFGDACFEAKERWTAHNPVPERHNPELWEGADDTWPEEPQVVPDPEISDTASKPEILVHQQWGLELPNGHIAWGSWSGISFTDPLDRVLMIANLQKTAQDCGFSEGGQTEVFLSNYGWVTRNQIATVVYEDTGAYTLTDPAVSASSIPVGETHHEQQQDDSDPSPHPSGDLREGSVGGDT